MRIAEAWRTLSPQQKVIAAGAGAAVALMLAVLGRTAAAPPMALLYSGLDPSVSGEILEALDAMGVRSEVKGDAIYVPKKNRDAVRMALAREELPRQSQSGFEILDDLNGFSTSSDMFDAAYWRAKEGELARTILSERDVTSARVHIAVPKRSAFARDKISPSAVVTVGLRSGKLDLERAQAMRLLVALATPGLSPEHVAVLDAGGGVVLAPGPDDAPVHGEGALQDRERKLEQDLINLLEARVGAGNARVKIALSLSDEQTVRQERLVDPERRALATSETTEISEQGVEGGGVVTVASNLPEGDAAGLSGAPARSKRNETQASNRFEISEVTTETVMMPGALRQVHVAVLINDPSAAPSDSAEQASPRPTSEMEALRKLVAAAVGFNEARGDVVTIESMPFEQLQPQGAEARKDTVADILQENLLPVLQLAIPAAVSLILALFVLRPLLMTSAAPGSVELSAPSAMGESSARLGVQSPPHADLKTPIDDLQRLATEQRATTSAVLRTWLERSEQA